MNTFISEWPSLKTTGVRVLVIDNHPVSVLGIHAALSSVSGFEVCGFPHGFTELSQLNQYTPDIVIVDFSCFHDFRESHLTKAVETSCPNAKILVFTTIEDPAYMHELFRLGIRGYLLKQSPSSELLRAINAVAMGLAYVDPVVAGRLLPLFDPASRPPNTATRILSEREIEVLKLVAWGLSDKEIGFDLGISVKSVGTYKFRALNKLGMRSRADVVRYAVGQRWLMEPNTPVDAGELRRLPAKH